MMVCFFVFFFQAEDGIRDVTVTGVQTCALPILPLSKRPMNVRKSPMPAAKLCFIDGDTALASHFRTPRRVMTMKMMPLTNRSEERRVGKECRSRWSTDH